MSTGVAWAVTGPGSIDRNGLYTAPPVGSAVNIPQTVTIQATSQADSTVSASVPLQLRYPGPVLTSASPNNFKTGNFVLKVTGTGFQPGAIAVIFTSTGLTQYPATYVDQGNITVTGSISYNGNTLLEVMNPNSMFSNTLALTITNSGGSNSLTVSPASASVPAGTSQTFSATLNSAPVAVSWSVQGGASFGTITAAGVYTAPAQIPNPPTATVVATGANNTTASATVSIISNQPPTITNASPNPLPLGVASFTITGTGFAAGSQVTIGGALASSTLSNGNLLVQGYSGLGPTTAVIVKNGQISSAPFNVNVGVANPLVSASAARRFLEQAAFGPTPADASHVQQVGFNGWLGEQFALPGVSNYQGLGSQSSFSTRFMTNSVMNPDQLRQKVAFALSQIFVTSINKNIWTSITGPFEEMLLADAFTNYRKILNDVTLFPAMGQFLDMANNGKANAQGTILPNENYAREVLQLFSIGTYMLNQDGTQQLDVSSHPIPTYTQPTITEFARVFTGWTYAPVPPATTVVWNSYINNTTSPMVPYQAQHDVGAKTLLQASMPPAKLSLQPGQSAAQDLSDALDNIYYHPNVAPFFCKQLIQHLVKSNPSPAYIASVAAVFNNNGSNVRGDMKAVITAILTNPEARANDSGGMDGSTDGHLQEPALYLAGIIRAFGGTVNDQNYFAFDLQNMAQDVFNAPSVFNYYSPGYRVPGVGILGPEFQIFNAATSIYRYNVAAGLFGAYNNAVQTSGPGMTVDFTPYVSLSNAPATLVNALDLALTHGTMPAGLKTIITNGVTAESGGSVARVETGVYLILASAYYNVWH